jgi:HK97 family phage portal protein
LVEAPVVGASAIYSLKSIDNTNKHSYIVGVKLYPLALLDNIKRFFPFLNFNKRGTYTPYIPNVFGNFTGKSVDSNSALGLSAVWGCTKVLSESIASLPLNIYERMADGDRLLADTHRLYFLLHNQPSKLYTSYTFIEYLVKSICLNGNGYAVINRDRNANIVSFTCINPTDVKILQEYGSLYYNIKGYDELIPAEDIIHVKNLTNDGILGMSPIQYAAESLGWGIALQTYGNTYFGNGGMPSGTLESDKVLTTEAVERLRQSWDKAYGGVDNANKVAVLEEGIQFKPVSISNESAQFLASRQWSISEIARWYRVPPHLIQDLSKSSFNNIEMQSMEFIQYTLTPLLKRFEQEFNSKVFKVNERNRFYVEFNVNGLLRGDAKTRADLYTKAIQWGWMSINEVRRKENLNAIPDGDEHLVPMNMTNLDADTTTE